jgi:hypothetical protein
LTLRPSARADRDVVRTVSVFTDSIDMPAFSWFPNIQRCASPAPCPNNSRVFNVHYRQ